MFYRSWWFDVLLGLLAINVGIAVFVRFPISRKRIGFVVTHASILTILVGALVTDQFGVDGQVSMAEGETVEHLIIFHDTLTLAKRGDETEKAADISGLPAGGLRPVERPAAEPLSLDGVSVEVVRYLPDSEELRKVVNDGPPGRMALEVSLSDPHVRGVEPAWVFADRTTRLGSMSVLFRKVDEEELRRLSEETPEAPKEQTKSLGSVRVDYQGASFEFPVEQCMQKAVALGETWITLKVLRYMPHALLDAGNRLRNASNRPVNPTIEVEVAGPEGTVKRPAFAKFPEFWSTHGPKSAAGLKVVFVASDAVAPSAPISVLSGPEGKLYARFAPDGQPVVIKELTIGKPCESPWVGRRLTVLRQFDRARVKQTATPIIPVRKKSRVPAALLEVKSTAGTERAWLQKYRSHSFMVDGSTYDLIYGNKRVPLGFSVTLKEARIGNYPGTGRPRSFESLITILDPVSVRKLNRVISMNNPAKFGGYKFFQSDMRPRGGRMVSTLSVSWDPGQPIVFAGYIGLMAGMLLLLGRRIADHRGPAVRLSPAGGAQRGRSKPSSSSK